MLLQKNFPYLAGWLAVLGGLFWVIKAGSILLTSYQPPQIFETAPLLFAVGLVGLYLRLGQRASGWGKAGVTLAVLAFFMRLVTTIYEATPNAVVSTGETFVFPFSLFVLIGAAGVFIGLILLGIDFFRAKLLPSPAHATPLTAGLLVLPITATAIIHIEIPILLIGLMWVWVGSTILQPVNFSEARYEYDTP